MLAKLCSIPITCTKETGKQFQSVIAPRGIVVQSDAANTMSIEERWNAPDPMVCSWLLPLGAVRNLSGYKAPNCPQK